MDTSLLFFILFLVCIWLILDQIYGKKYIGQFVAAVFPVLGK